MYSKINASVATLTRTRTGEDISPSSGMCVTCLDGCVGLCEVGKSAYRGAEVIYPAPFGAITTAAQKQYPVDLSHFNIMGTAVGAHGIAEDSDLAIFPNVDLRIKIGQGKGIKLALPFIIPGLGSTDVAKNNWEGLAVGAAMSGIPLTIGENVCGMDMRSRIENGRVVDSPELAWRVGLYKQWQRDGQGAIIVQSNVEDTRLGVLEYALAKLGVEAVELKWGQGAKNIGGEVKISDLAKAQELKRRGYILQPDPEDPVVVEAFKRGAFNEFERHSRVGMVTEESFAQRVKELRNAGAKYVFLKTGAYRPADLARAVKFSSKYGIDLLTVDAAGGGTGMSPWRMMNEWGVPPVNLFGMLYRYADTLAKKGQYVPDIAIAGGFTLEDQAFKGLALGAPYFKLIGMARAPLAAAMVGKTIGKKIAEGSIPNTIEKYGQSLETIFVTTARLKKDYNNRFEQLPPGAIGLYTYLQRVTQGLRQLMTGARKFSLEQIARGDIAALTRDAAEMTGITYIDDLDKDEVKKILG